MFLRPVLSLQMQRDFTKHLAAATWSDFAVRNHHRSKWAPGPNAPQVCIPVLGVRTPLPKMTLFQERVWRPLQDDKQRLEGWKGEINPELTRRIKKSPSMRKIRTPQIFLD